MPSINYFVKYKKVSSLPGCCLKRLSANITAFAYLRNYVCMHQVFGNTSLAAPNDLM